MREVHNLGEGGVADAVDGVSGVSMDMIRRIPPTIRRWRILYQVVHVCPIHTSTGCRMWWGAIDGIVEYSITHSWSTSKNQASLLFYLRPRFYPGYLCMEEALLQNARNAKEQNIR